MDIVMDRLILCSECFNDFGLKKMAERIGVANSGVCPNCRSSSGALLDEDGINDLCNKYFVDGSYYRSDFGGSPTLMMVNRSGEFNLEHDAHNSLRHDLKLIFEKTGLTPLDYGPAMWRVGVTEWMERLTSRNWKRRDKAIEELKERCGIKEIGEDSRFYRIRTNVEAYLNEENYDAPHSQRYNGGRLNLNGGVVFYASFDVETCIHECRANMEDSLYLATLEPCRVLRLLDFNDVHEKESEQTPFDSLPLAVRQLFMAASHSYDITRRISKLVMERGFDGIQYPSYFNCITNKTCQNIALYGHVIKNKKVRVKSLDRILLNQVKYEFDYGPCMD